MCCGVQWHVPDKHTKAYVLVLDFFPISHLNRVRELELFFLHFSSLLQTDVVVCETIPERQQPQVRNFNFTDISLLSYETLTCLINDISISMVCSKWSMPLTNPSGFLTV